MSKLSKPAFALLHEILAARSFDIPISNLTDREIDLVPELEEHDFLVVLDPDGDDPSVTLGETAIRYADIRWDDRESRWVKVRLLPETDLAIAREVAKGRVKTVYETDLNATRLSQGRSRVGIDGIIATGVRNDDDDGPDSCGTLVGTDEQWDGPDSANLVRETRACAICSRRGLVRGEHCLKCSRDGGEARAVRSA